MTTIADALDELAAGATVVNLAGSGIGPGGAAVLAEGLASSETLVELHLHNNAIGPKGVRAVLSALGLSRGARCCSGSAIEELNLSRNALGVEGAEMVGAALGVRTPLLRLRLPGNFLYDDGARFIADGIASNDGTLKAINLAANDIGPDGAASIAAALSANVGLAQVELDDNPFEASGWEAIAAALETNSTVTSLSTGLSAGSGPAAGDGMVKYAAGRIGEQLAVNKALRGALDGASTAAELRAFLHSRVIGGLPPVPQVKALHAVIAHTSRLLRGILARKTGGVGWEEHAGQLIELAQDLAGDLAADHAAAGAAQRVIEWHAEGERERERASREAVGVPGRAVLEFLAASQSLQGWELPAGVQLQGGRVTLMLAARVAGAVTQLSGWTVAIGALARAEERLAEHADAALPLNAVLGATACAERALEELSECQDVCRDLTAGPAGGADGDADQELKGAREQRDAARAAFVVACDEARDLAGQSELGSKKGIILRATAADMRVEADSIDALLSVLPRHSATAYSYTYSAASSSPSPTSTSPIPDPSNVRLGRGASGQIADDVDARERAGFEEGAMHMEGVDAALRAVREACDRVHAWSVGAHEHTVRAAAAARSAAVALADAQDAVSTRLRNPSEASESLADPLSLTFARDALGAVIKASELLSAATLAVEMAALDPQHVTGAFPTADAKEGLRVASDALHARADRIEAAVAVVDRLGCAAEDNRPWMGVETPLIVDEVSATAKTLRKARKKLAKAHARLEHHVEGDSDSDSSHEPLPTEDDILALRCAVTDAVLAADKASLRAVQIANDHFPELHTGLLAMSGPLRDLFESHGVVVDRKVADYFISGEAPLAQAGQGVRHTVHRAEFEGRARALKEFRGVASSAPSSSGHVDDRLGHPADSDSGSLRRRFVREVRHLARAVHPNIVEINCAFIDGADAYIDMPLYAGGDLGVWLAGRPHGGARPYVERHRVLAAVARGLEFLHRLGITHCDVKPRNVLMESVADTAAPRIADFDASRDENGRGAELLSTASSSMSLAAGGGSVAGTLAYMAPELFLPSANAGTLTTGVDVYAFGVAIAEVLAPEWFSGRYSGAPGTPLAIMDAIFPPEVTAADPLRDLLGAMCARDPCARPTMTEVLEHPFFSDPVRHEREEATRRAAEAAEEANRIEAWRAQLQSARDEIEDETFRVSRERRRADAAITEARRAGEAIDAQMHRAAEEARETEARIERTRKELNLEATRVASAFATLAAASAASGGSTMASSVGSGRRDGSCADGKSRGLGAGGLHLTEPHHWTALGSLDPRHTARRVDVTGALGVAVERLMNATAAKEEGWILGGRNFAGRHKSFRVTKVTRVENPAIMREYAFARGNLASKAGHKRGGVAVRREDVLTGEDNVLWRELGHDAGGGNEVFLFHGSTFENVPVIVQQGFDERVSNLKGFFGAALYFAENSSKAAEFSPLGKRRGAKGKSSAASTTSGSVMILARVALGRTHEQPPRQLLRQERRPPCLRGGHTDCTHERADSVVCIASKKFGYRSFMIYDRRQAYPELIIEFVRK
jgi:serine/threonine protein kinase